MVVRTNTERVRHSRKLILELLGSSVDLSLASPDLKRHMREYGAEPERLAGAHASRSRSRSTTICTCATTRSCVLCYKCVEACGDRRAEHVRHRRRRAAGSRRASRPRSDRPLPDSACVYCGNCIGVCPTGALMFKSEHDMRAGRHVGRVEADRHRHDLPLLRRRLHAAAPRPGQRHRPCHIAARPRRHARPSLHQGPLRLAVVQNR